MLTRNRKAARKSLMLPRAAVWFLSQCRPEIYPYTTYMRFFVPRLLLRNTATGYAYCPAGNTATGYAYCPAGNTLRGSAICLRQIRLTNLYTAFIFQKASIHRNSQPKCSHFQIHSNKINENLASNHFTSSCVEFLESICCTFAHIPTASPHPYFRRSNE